MAKHYTIDETKKIIYANILALTEKEEKEIERFVKFGFTVENKVETKAKVERLNETYILDYLKDNDEEAITTYKSKVNEAVVDDNGKVKTTSTGKTKRKGFNAGRNWFSKTYPEDITDIKKLIKEAGEEENFNKVYNAYKKKSVKEQAENKDFVPLTEEEYTRDYYWKNVFVRN